MKYSAGAATPRLRPDGTGARAYQRLAEQIMGMIAAGEFQVGERLPSERTLADRFQVRRTSVREAVIADFLSHLGWNG